jgi:hypothetical protein
MGAMKRCLRKEAAGTRSMVRGGGLEEVVLVPGVGAHGGGGEGRGAGMKDVSRSTRGRRSSSDGGRTTSARKENVACIVAPRVSQAW